MLVHLVRASFFSGRAPNKGSKIMYQKEKQPAAGGKFFGRFLPFSYMEKQ
jgi:hypothetical protein